MPRLTDIRCAIILVALSILVWLPRWRGPIDLRSDAGVYYILGTSLAEGRGYRLLNEPGDIQAIQYPPLLPALVTLHQRILGTSDERVVAPWLRLSFSSLAILYAVAIYGLARQYLAPGYSLLVALIGAFDVNVISYSEMLYAELPFTLVTVLFVLAHKMSRHEWPSIPTALLGVSTYLIRSAGITLLAAWVAEALLKGRWKPAVVRAGVVLVPVVAWQSYIHRVKAGDEYRHPAYSYQRADYQMHNVTYIENILLVDPFVPHLGHLTPAGLGARIAANLAIAPGELGRLVLGGETLRQWLSALDRRLPASFPRPDRAVNLVLLSEAALLLAGIGLLSYRGEWLIPLHLAASLALIGVLPWSAGFQRYLTPLQPFLFLSLFVLLSAFAEATLRRWSGPARLLGPAFLVLISTLILVKETISDFRSLLVVRYPVYRDAESGAAEGYKLMRYDVASYKLDEALGWLKGHAGRGEVLATQAPHWAYLKTGLKAIFPPMEIDPARAESLLEAVPVDYLLLDETNLLDVTPRYAEPVVGAYPDRWRLVYTAPGSRTRIYRNVRPGVE
jgi:hypothetical protein